MKIEIRVDDVLFTATHVVLTEHGDLLTQELEGEWDLPAIRCGVQIIQDGPGQWRARVGETGTVRLPYQARWCEPQVSLRKAVEAACLIAGWHSPWYRADVGEG